MSPIPFAVFVPVFDFAGGTVVHITSGFSALAAAIIPGKRRGYPTEPIKPHSLVFSFIGACVLWVGWFGFNAGSALAASALATSAFVAAHFASAAGAVAGLAAVTQGAGFVEPFSAVLIGFVAGFGCFAMVTIVKIKLGYDGTAAPLGWVEGNAAQVMKQEEMAKKATCLKTNHDL